MGAALEAGGYDTSASFTGAVIVETWARPPAGCDGAQLTSQSGDVAPMRSTGAMWTSAATRVGRVNGSPAPGQPGRSSVTVESAGLLQAQSLAWAAKHGRARCAQRHGAGTRLRVSGETNIGGSGWVP